MAPNRPAPDPGPVPSTAELQNEIAGLQGGLKDALQRIKALSDPPKISNTSSQLIGNGTFQALNPSFSAVSVGLTGLKIDETGVSLYGKTLYDFHKDKALDAIKTGYPGVADSVRRLQISVAALKRVTVSSGEKVALLQDRLTVLVDSMNTKASSGRVLGIRRPGTSVAELEELKRGLEGVVAVMGH